MFAPPSARCNFFKCTPPNLKSWIRPCTLRFYFPYLSLLYFIMCSDIFQHIILIYFNVFPSLIIFNIFLLFIATELLLVIANSCLEAFATWITHRRLCRVKKMLAMYLKYLYTSACGLLFVIANSTSILHVCLNVIAMILCSA